MDERDLDALTDEQAARFHYRGNSVAYWIVRAEARGKGLDRAWQAMTEAGFPADGNTPLANAITNAIAALRASAEQAEADAERYRWLRDDKSSQILARPILAKVLKSGSIV